VYAAVPSPDLRGREKWDLSLRTAGRSPGAPRGRPALRACALRPLAGNPPLPTPVDGERRYLNYVLYGDAGQYRRRLARRLAEAPFIFPGWRVRVFVPAGAFSETFPFVADLVQGAGGEVFVVGAPDAMAPDASAPDAVVRGDGSPREPLVCPPPMMWRFLFGDQPEVDRQISRDLDSRLIARDARAVSEWIESGRPMHVMRDSPRGHNYAVNGGMFGTTRAVLAGPAGYPGGWRQAVAAWMQSSGEAGRQRPRPAARETPQPARGKDYLKDMRFLAGYVFQAVLPSQRLEHDSHTCKSWPGAIPFPDEALEDGQYVGQAFDEDGRDRYPKVSRLIATVRAPRACTVRVYAPGAGPAAGVGAVIPPGRAGEEGACRRCDCAAERRGRWYCDMENSSGDGATSCCEGCVLVPRTGHGQRGTCVSDAD
jgi:hypothetical protein